MNRVEALKHPSGGWVYHWRALRYRNALWMPFRAHVENWLSAWHPPREHLLLVGPSAGYTLPPGLATRFVGVTVLEPDPLARWLLRRQPQGRRLIFDPVPDLEAPDALARLAARYPDHAILFCNILGQLDAPATGDAEYGWAAPLAAALSGHCWASFHDCFSSDSPPNARRPREWHVGLAYDQPPDRDSLIGRFWKGRDPVLIDHGCLGLGGPTAPHQYALWQLTPNDWHLIEWTWHAPRDDD